MGLRIERFGLAAATSVSPDRREAEDGFIGLAIPDRKRADAAGFACGMVLLTREGGVTMKFYTIRLPRFLGGFVKAILNTFSKN